MQTWQRQPGSAPGAAPVASGRPSPNRARLVVAEDNDDLRTYLGDVLGEQYELELVPDGAAALDAVRRETPDLVLADVMMPGPRRLRPRRRHPARPGAERGAGRAPLGACR